MICIVQYSLQRQDWRQLEDHKSRAAKQTCLSEAPESHHNCHSSSNTCWCEVSHRPCMTNVHQTRRTARGTANAFNRARCSTLLEGHPPNVISHRWGCEWVVGFLLGQAVVFVDCVPPEGLLGEACLLTASFELSSNSER
eukprot:4107808-Amphidinium_carterae.1